MEERYKNHVSGLYLLCPTIPPRVLSSEQWWGVVKELNGLCHTVPLLREDFRKSSLIQLEYLIVQFLQSTPPLLAIRWLMSAYSLINKYVKLSVGKLLSETMLLLYRFTGNSSEELDPSRSRLRDLTQTGAPETGVGASLELPRGRILDITDSPDREIQPSQVIASLYVIQTLIRLEILETRRHFPGLIKSIPQLLVHVDPGMRNAANECLLTSLPLGVPGYSLSDQLLGFLLSGVRILLELDDSLNLERTMQSISIILAQQPRLASSKRQDILQLVVNISSSLGSEQNQSLKNSGLLDSISSLLSNSTISDFKHFQKSPDLLGCVTYIAGISNIKFSTYGLGSLPVQGECFRIILANSILKILHSQFSQSVPTLSQLECTWNLLLEHLQAHFIRKHVTENLQWLTNNHWVFLWVQILKRVLLISLSSIQNSLIGQSFGLEAAGTLMWTKIESFLGPLSKISPRISLECALHLLTMSDQINWIWKLSKDFFELFLNWVLETSQTENFEISLTSYLSGRISAILMGQHFGPYCESLKEFGDNLQSCPISEKIKIILKDFLFPGKARLRINKKENDDSEICETLIHSSHFLIGFSNSSPSLSALLTILDLTIDFITESPDFQLFSNTKDPNQLFVFNNLFLLVQNLLANILYLSESHGTEKRLTGTSALGSKVNTIFSKLSLLIPIWKSTLSQGAIEKFCAVVESLKDSCERIQLLTETNNPDLRVVFEEDDENPVIFLLKDVKQWLGLLWTVIESVQSFIRLADCLGREKNPLGSELHKLEKFLIKACFYTLENLLPCIPPSWTTFFPETETSHPVTSEFSSAPHSSFGSLDNLKDAMKSFSPPLTLHGESLEASQKVILKEETHRILQTIEKFNFPYVGDRNCFSRCIHLSALILSLKLSVYRQLNGSLFFYHNHPPVSNKCLLMLILDLASDHILTLNLKISSEVFPTPSGKEKPERNPESSTPEFVPINDIFVLPEFPAPLNVQNDIDIVSQLGLLESMKSRCSFPSISNIQTFNSGQSREIHLRKEASELLSNFVSEIYLRDRSSPFVFDVLKMVFKTFLKKSIYSQTYWSWVVSESQCGHSELPKSKIQNLFPGYSDLSPSLFLMSLKSLVAPPNDITILPLLSLLWFIKSITENLIFWIDAQRAENGSQDLLLYIFSFLIKVLFGFRSLDLKKQINNQDQKNGKRSPPRIKSSVVRYYSLNLLTLIFRFLQRNKSMGSHYYNCSRQKIEYLIAWANFSLSRTGRSNEDSEALSDLYVFLALVKTNTPSLDQDLSHIIEVFLKDHLSGNVSEKNKFFILKLKMGLRVENKCIGRQANIHFGFEESPSEPEDSSKIEYFTNLLGEYSCFYNLVELANLGILSYSLDFLQRQLKILLKDDQQEDYKSVSNLTCIFVSLLFCSRVHEVPLLDLNSLTYVPNCCTTFFRGDLLPDFWKLTRKFYFSCPSFGPYVEVTGNLKATQKHSKEAPYLNLIGLLIVMALFVTRRTEILENLKAEDFDLFLRQNRSFLPAVFHWSLANTDTKISLFFLENSLNPLNLQEVNSILAGIIRSLTGDFDSQVPIHPNNYSNFSNFLLDEEDSLNLSPFIIYTQLWLLDGHSGRSSSKYELPDQRKHHIETILNTRLTQVLEISERICDSLQFKIVHKTPLDALLQQETIAFSLRFLPKGNISKEIPNVHILKKTSQIFFSILSSLLDLFETNLFNQAYLENQILNKVLSILNLAFSAFSGTSQILAISEYSGTIEKLVILLAELSSKDPQSNLFYLLSNFLVGIFDSLSIKHRKDLWNILLSNANQRFGDGETESSHFGTKLVCNLIQVTGLNLSPGFLSHGNEQDLISILARMVELTTGPGPFGSELLTQIAFIGYFITESIPNLKERIQKSNMERLFNENTLRALISKIFDLEEGKVSQVKIHYIPSLISIWNSINSCQDFFETLIELLTYCYSAEPGEASLKAILFFMETLSSIHHLTLRDSCDGFSLEQNLTLSFQELALGYFTGKPFQNTNFAGLKDPESFELERNIQNFRIGSHNSFLLGMIFQFSLKIFDSEFVGLKDIPFSNLDPRLVCLRVYKLISEFGTLEGTFQDEGRQVELLKRSGKAFLSLYRRISKQDINLSSAAKCRMEREGFELAISNMKLLVERGKFQILQNHSFWIEEEIKKCLLNLERENENLNYLGHLLDILNETLVETHQVIEQGKHFPEEDEKARLELQDTIFHIYKYLLYAQTYSNHEYFQIFRSFLLSMNKENEVEAEKGIHRIPDLTRIMKYQENLSIIALGRLGELSEKSSSFNKEVFELLILLLLPFNYSYSLEFGNFENMTNCVSPPESWGLLRNLVLSEKRDKKEVVSRLALSMETGVEGEAPTVSGPIKDTPNLLTWIRRFLEEYQRLLGGMGDHFSGFVLPASCVVAWYQTLFEEEGKNLLDSLGLDSVPNSSESPNMEFSEWIRLGGFFLPENQQQILVEIPPKPEKAVNGERKEAFFKRQYIEREILEILEIIDFN
ncbi:Armadillo-like helical-containing protein [Cryptosporidium felis]|nr:Armadillo-like helical-containing protein [Cryptosporidium felis]